MRLKLVDVPSDNGVLFINDEGRLESAFSEHRNGDEEQVHLYLVAEVPIHKGDWMYDDAPPEDLPFIRQMVDGHEYFGGGFYKVLMTTDIDMVIDNEEIRFLKIFDNEVASVLLGNYNQLIDRGFDE